MLALNFTISFKKHLVNDGRLKAYLRHLRRYVIFIGLGLFLFMDISESGILFQWGTLQVLGMSGLLFLPFAETHWIVKSIIATIYISIHQLILFTPLDILIFDSIEAGILGSFSWGAMMIYSVILAEGLKKENKVKFFLVGGLNFLLIGIATSFFFGISRGYMTLPYVFISVGVSSLIFCIFFLVFENQGRKQIIKKVKVLSSSGKNAFLLFLLHIISLFFFYEMIPALFFLVSEEFEWMIIFPFALLNTAIILIIGWFLDRIGIYLII
jgi:hypothetical protein